MSIRLDLEGSLVQVAPTLDDVEAVLIVRTRFRDPEVEGADGVVRRTALVRGRKTRTALPRIEVHNEACFETRIGANDAKGGQPEYEVRSVYRAGGAGQVFLTTDRRVKFALRWYGEQRYLELRLRVTSGAEIVANRGMGPLGVSGAINFLGRTKPGEWVEIHYDNQTHVGLSMTLHPASHDFTTWKHAEKPPKAAPLIRSRFDRVLKSE